MIQYFLILWIHSCRYIITENFGYTGREISVFFQKNTKAGVRIRTLVCEKKNSTAFSGRAEGGGGVCNKLAPSALAGVGAFAGPRREK